MRRETELVELRGLMPRYVIDVIDAVAIHKRVDRMAVACAVLQTWADQKLHESTLLERVARSNGSPRTVPEDDQDDVWSNTTPVALNIERRKTKRSGSGK